MTLSQDPERADLVKLDPVNKLQLLHQQLGHRNIPDLVHLANKGLLRNLTINGRFQAFDCPVCAVAKAKRKPFPQEAQGKPRHILEKISSDGCGKLPTPSLTGAEHFVTYSDAKSRYRWTFLLKRKSEQPAIFKRLQVQLERQFDTKIKILHSDNGGE